MPRKLVATTGKASGKEEAAARRSAISRAVSTASRRTISIIGAGRLGTALALALSARGHHIASLVARHTPHARRAVSLLPKNGTLALGAAQLERLPPSDIIFITTPDDNIEATARELSARIGWSGRSHIALHASGALSSEVLGTLSALGFSTGSMHPLISVSDPHLGALSLGEAHYCLEGARRAVRAAGSLVRDMGGRSFSIRSADKALYHAAAVMSSGHLVALFDIATELLKGCGLTASEARGALLPLVQSTLDNLSQQQPARALTGTFARADVATVGKHLEALAASERPDALDAYITLGLRSLELARENGADEEALRLIRRALEAAPKRSKR